MENSDNSQNYLRDFYYDLLILSQHRTELDLLNVGFNE